MSLQDKLNKIAGNLGTVITSAFRLAMREEMGPLLKQIGAKRAKATAAASEGDGQPKKRGRPKGSKTTTPPKAATSAKKEKTRGAGSPIRAIVNLLKTKKTGGLRFEEIHKRLNLDSQDCREGLVQLEEQGRIRREGKARGTTYILIPKDEGATGDDAEGTAVEGAPAEGAPAEGTEGSTAAEGAAAEGAAPEAPKKKRGRPRKNPVAPPAQVEAETVATEGTKSSAGEEEAIAPRTIFEPDPEAAAVAEE